MPTISDANWSYMPTQSQLTRETQRVLALARNEEISRKLQQLEQENASLKKGCSDLEIIINNLRASAATPVRAPEAPVGYGLTKPRAPNLSFLVSPVSIFDSSQLNPADGAVRVPQSASKSRLRMPILTLNKTLPSPLREAADESRNGEPTRPELVAAEVLNGSPQVFSLAEPLRQSRSLATQLTKCQPSMRLASTATLAKNPRARKHRMSGLSPMKLAKLLHTKKATDQLRVIPQSGGPMARRLRARK